MLTLTEIFAILIVHWIGDFVLQTDKQAKGKSSSNLYLISHTFYYSLFSVLFWFILFQTNISFPDVFYKEPNHINLFTFFWITFISHTITDYFTSRLNKKLWDKGQVHNFFVSIGFDQILHYAQLFITYYFLKN